MYKENAIKNENVPPHGREKGKKRIDADVLHLQMNLLLSSKPASIVTNNRF
jgi:hypothetical protein